MPVFSSASRSVSWAICAFRRFSAVSLPATSCWQIELHDHEHGQQEDDAEDQRRQRVDEARPVIHAAVAAASSCQRHNSLNGYVLAHHDLQQLLDLALLLGLRVDPVADHLLLGAHMVHKALDRFGEIGHRGGRGLPGLDLVDRIAQPLDRGAHFARHAGGSAGFGGHDRSTVVESQSSSSV